MKYDLIKPIVPNVLIAVDKTMESNLDQPPFSPFKPLEAKISIKGDCSSMSNTLPKTPEK
jgi:hypothetical protein